MQVLSMLGQAHPYDDQWPFSAGITCALTRQLWRHMDEGQTASGCPIPYCHPGDPSTSLTPPFQPNHDN